jgi:hypothetical protein
VDPSVANKFDEREKLRFDDHFEYTLVAILIHGETHVQHGSIITGRSTHLLVATIRCLLLCFAFAGRWHWVVGGCLLSFGEGKAASTSKGMSAAWLLCGLEHGAREGVHGIMGLLGKALGWGCNAKSWFKTFKLLSKLVFKQIAKWWWMTYGCPDLLLCTSWWHHTLLMNITFHQFSITFFAFSE